MSSVAHEPGEQPSPGSWFKSSFSAEAVCCVEVSVNDGHVFVRDSKFRRVNGDSTAEPILSYTPAEWDAFVRGVKAGEFDL